MQELRLVLIIVGVLAISALLLHGLWSSRKDKPAKFGEKPIGRLDEGKTKDNEGFDQDGIGSVRVIANGGEPEAPAKRPARKEPELHFGDELAIDPLFDAPATPAAPVAEERRGEISQDSQPEVTASVQTSASVEEAVLETVIPEVEVQAEAEVIQQAPQSEPQFVSADSRVSEQAILPQTEEVQVEAAQQVSEVPLAEPEAPVEEVKLEPDFLVLNVHARGGEMLTGVKLFQCLERHHLIYGENSVYHRHADLAGTGPVLFTVANMVSPGYFPQDQLDEFATPGVAFYLMLPCHGRADDNFNLMLQTVQRIADDMGADILDHERNLITPQRLKAYREKAKQYL
ncbi:cell division protein ZipA [Photobacterium sp. CCB-ST2H9]|uniref:cell division protein ZipA n=1 Tax=Photobacterium sp. CCB-ST2H9 TaxID=2912855 RepID=UPI002003D8A2|nr:cell division protein ZipA [Photobacterium sp. CCB-ST2H9]UTM58053.1 cell division protein ZipA [Photobacterium sp. CCB-ST2H9]